MDEQEQYSLADPLFKGCTRPAMFMGVPLVPLMFVCSGELLLAAWFTLFLLILIPVSVIVMRMIVAHDDQQFRLLGLRFKFRLQYTNRNSALWGASSYSPIAYRLKRK